MYNNDPFKKMDLNFDPTQEANIEPKEPTPNQGKDMSFETTTPGQHQPVQPAQPHQPMQQNSAFVDQRVIETVVMEKTKEQNLSAVDAQFFKDILSDEKFQKAASSISGETTTGVPTRKDLERTIEFIVQAEKTDSEEVKKVREERKKKEKDAKKSKLRSFSWLFIMILSIIFGITSIWTFGVDVADFVKNVTAEEPAILKAIGQFFTAFFHSFEAILFMFFIFFSLRRFRKFYAPYKKWYVDTEPFRIAAAYKIEVERHNSFLEQMTIYQLTWTPTFKEKLEGMITLKDKLEYIKNDNVILEKTIKNHEAELKAKAKPAKK